MSTIFSKFNKLQTRSLITVLVLSIVPVSIFYSFIVSTTEDRFVESLSLELTEKAYLVGADIDRFFAQRERDVRIITQADVLETNNNQAIEKYLIEVLAETPFLSEIAIVSNAGSLILSTSKQTEPTDWNSISNLQSTFALARQSFQGAVYVNEFQSDQTGTVVVFVSPITDESNEKIEKLLAVKVNLVSISEILTDLDQRIIGNKSVTIVNNAGHVVLAPLATSLANRLHPDMEIFPNLLLHVSQQGDVGSVLYTDHMNEPVMSAFADMDEFGLNNALDWSILVTAPINEVLAPINDIKNDAVLLFFVIMILTVLAYILMNRSINKDLHKLRDGAIAFGEGDLTHRISSNSVSELEEIATQFNSMADKRLEDEESLKAALQTAEEHNQVKSEFLAKMSHELRTPLNAIIGFSDLMTEEVFGPMGAKRYKQYARDINNSGTHLLNLVNQILDISAVEAGKLSFKMMDIEITAVVRECIRTVTPLAENKRLEISNLEATKKVLVKADRSALTQVFLNLLTNSIKFTPDEGRIYATSEIIDNHISIQIKDTGIGIAQGEINNILEPFTQANQDAHLTNDGLGLGLSICKMIVEEHGGSIIVESAVGVGTMVVVTLPVIELLDHKSNVTSLNTRRS